MSLIRNVLIIGAGQAGAQTAYSLRQQGFSGGITIVGDEPALPYQRPPLSKGYLKGELPAERLFLKPEAYYSDHNIDLKLSIAARRIVLSDKTVELANGEVLPFDALVIATGARPRKLDIPSAGLEGVLELRTLADVDQLRAHAREGVRAVIVGAGYIGLETAAVLRAMGAEVLVLEAAPQILGRVAGPEIAEFLTEQHTRSGVEIRLNSVIEAFEGEGHLTGVRLGNGDVIPANIALIGIGVIPNQELAAEAGITCANGIVVDDGMRTSVEGVYAVGDVAWRPLPLYARQGRLESVHNAIEGGKIAAAGILGVERPAMDVPWFWSDQYEVKLQTAGLWSGADASIVRGSPEDGKFAVYYLRDGVLLAIDAVSSPPDFIVGKKLVAAGVSPSPELLADETISVKDISARLLG